MLHIYIIIQAIAFLIVFEEFNNFVFFKVLLLYFLFIFLNINIFAC